MATIKKFAIKIDGVGLFYCGGGWKATPEDATQFNTVEEAKAKAVNILESIDNNKPKPPLSVVTLNVNPPNDNW